MEKVKKFWRWITYQRHRSELVVLRRSKGLYIFSFFPIFLNLAFWWFLFCLPLSILVMILYPLLGIFDGEVSVFGIAVFAVIQVLALGVLLAAAPWFFHWYFIALTLSFGGKSMAEKKEKFLHESTSGYEKSMRAQEAGQS